MPKCKGCGKEIVFADIADEKGILTGKRVPLDTAAPVYQVDASQKAGQPERVAYRRRDTFVSHFVTCPKANQFSGGKSHDGSRADIKNGN